MCSPQAPARIVGTAIAAFFLSAIAVLAQEQSVDELRREIEQLRKENAKLKEDVNIYRNLYKAVKPVAELLSKQHRESQSIGIPRSKFTELFSKPDYGFKFSDGKKDKYTGERVLEGKNEDQHALIRLVGNEKDNLLFAQLAFSGTSDLAKNINNAWNATEFLKVADPDWDSKDIFDWSRTRQR